MKRKLGEMHYRGELNVLDRLAIVGNDGMGAIIYEPCLDLKTKTAASDLDVISSKCERVLLNETIDSVDELFSLSCSSGGTRPKIVLKYDGREWILKFKARYDNENI